MLEAVDCTREDQLRTPRKNKLEAYGSPKGSSEKRTGRGRESVESRCEDPRNEEGRRRDSTTDGDVDDKRSGSVGSRVGRASEEDGVLVETGVDEGVSGRDGRHERRMVE